MDHPCLGFISHQRPWQTPRASARRSLALEVGRTFSGTLLVWATLFGILIPPSVGNAQDTTGELQGRLVDETGVTISHAEVEVSSRDLLGTRKTITSSDGTYRFHRLPVGTYDLTIAHEGFHTIVLHDLDVRLGATTFLPLVTLRSETSDVEEMVVTSTALLLDVTSSTVGAELAAEDFDGLPIQRDYRNLPTLLPQANPSFLGDDVNFAGATGLENKYFVDGVDVTDPYRGTTGMRLPYNFIRAIEVKSGGYQAEHRSGLGGTINVITPSGRNDFHGQVFGFYANNDFAGSSRAGAYEPATGDFSQYDVGFSLGGPIARDRLWFRAAYNPTVEEEEVDIPGIGLHEDQNIVHIFAGKLDWRATERVNVDFSLFGDLGHRDAVGVIFGNSGVPVGFENPDPFLARLETGGMAASLRADYTPNETLLLESEVSVSTRRDNLQGLTERGRNEALFIDNETGLWSGGYPTPTDDHSRRIGASVVGSLFVSNHVVKMGVEYVDLESEIDEIYRQIERTSDTDYSTVLLDIEGTVGNRIPSAFVQDSWQIHDRVLVNAGLRWDGQFLIDSNGGVAQKITDQYQPRLGFAVQTKADGTQRLFGSFARFYHNLSTALSATAHVEGAVFEYTVYDHDPREDSSGGTVFGGALGIHPEVEGLRGQYYDEVSLGYEMALAGRFKTGVVGVYHELKEAIEGGLVDGGLGAIGNPGHGLLSDYPRAKRKYRALVFSVESANVDRFYMLASYVLSQNLGNYPGLFNSDFGYEFPNANGSFDTVASTVDSYGLLPNDRTHVFKVAGSYRTPLRLTLGSSFYWASGTPKSIFDDIGDLVPVFGQPRGTAGRTPSIWDLNFRLAYDLPYQGSMSWRPRLLVDVFHLGSPRKAVAFDQLRTFLPGVPNPNFGRATRYQPPTSVRLALEVAF